MSKKKDKVVDREEKKLLTNGPHFKSYSISFPTEKTFVPLIERIKYAFIENEAENGIDVVLVSDVLLCLKEFKETLDKDLRKPDFIYPDDIFELIKRFFGEVVK